jgi:ribosomal protein S18 acetylase RimI-like enzyme
VKPERELDDGSLPTDSVLVRDLRETDLAAIVKIDRVSTGRTRREYYESKLKTALAEQKLRTSLVAELDDHPVGFLLAHVHYGEFGRAEPVAVIDSIGVDPDYRGRHVGQALLRQLLMNLGALQVERIESQVDWAQTDLLTFLSRNGFGPAARICLERRL